MPRDWQHHAQEGDGYCSLPKMKANIEQVAGRRGMPGNAGEKHEHYGDALKNLKCSRVEPSLVHEFVNVAVSGFCGKSNPRIR